ncbi:MAG: rhodanese-like domain-containing protein [Firmicutes bacterium]|nr:rhodanese-like domain-containing protein [Bacillota bacterium]MDD7602620.1 rhodanese-like domain-containing protein [Bacillota bacterium]MDY5857166.1 rhodanese-like domain-containing protein [Anaerovoracaceae bacterium]
MRRVFQSILRFSEQIRPALILCMMTALCGGLLAACGLSGSDGEVKEDEYMKITMEQAQNLMETEENYVILDVRREDEYDAGHIPGAVCLPNESITAETAAEVLPDPAQMILVYCRSGNRSKQAAAKLAALGYSDIREFGGILDWPGEIEK